MGRYIIRRALWAILVLLIVVFLTYMIFFLLPSGDPALRLAGGKATNPRLLDEVRAQFGLNHPWYIQYLLFLKHAFVGDQYGWPGLGLSFVTKVPLKNIVFSRVAVTAQLAVGAAIVTRLKTM